MTGLAVLALVDLAETAAYATHRGLAWMPDSVCPFRRELPMLMVAACSLVFAWGVRTRRRELIHRAGVETITQVADTYRSTKTTVSRALRAGDRRSFEKRLRWATASLALSLFTPVLIVPCAPERTVWLGCFATASSLFFLRWKRHQSGALILAPLASFLTALPTRLGYAAALFFLFVLLWARSTWAERNEPAHRRGLGGYGRQRATS